MEDLNLKIFTRKTKEDWIKLAATQLKGADPLHELAWSNAALIELDGYYDFSDIEKLSDQLTFFTNLESHQWKIYELIEVDESETANKKALSALMGGADGIIFNLKNKVAFAPFLKDIDLEICDVSIIGESVSKEDHNLNGFNLSPTGNCINAIQFHDPTKQIQEIVDCRGSKKHIYRTAFKDFFLEIATIRAIRFILQNDIGIVPVIHTHIAAHEALDRQWFLNTSAGLASIIGGSHSVSFTTSQGDSRISRNVGNLIREESGIVEYSDQCGGSYYIEVLTNKLIQQIHRK